MSSHPGAINTRAKSASLEFVDPGKQIRPLFWKKPPAFLLIQEDDRPCREAFPPRRCNRRERICRAQFVGILLQLTIQPSVEEDEETEARGFDAPALAHPSVGLCARRIVQPIAREGKHPVKLSETVVAGIFVPIEAEVVGGWISRVYERCVTSERNNHGKSCENL